MDGEGGVEGSERYFGRKKGEGFDQGLERGGEVRPTSLPRQPLAPRLSGETEQQYILRLDALDKEDLEEIGLIAPSREIPETTTGKTYVGARIGSDGRQDLTHALEVKSSPKVVQSGIKLKNG